MKFNKILVIAILAVCLVSIGFVGAAGATVSADFTAKQGSGTDALTATVTASADNLNYVWSCSDGTIADKNSKSTKITFTTYGSHDVTLNVTSKDDSADNASRTIGVVLIETEDTRTGIDTISITLAAPVKGGEIKSTAAVSGTGAGTSATVTWEPDDTGVFKADTAYKATITVSADSTHKFTSATTVKLNEEAISSKEILEDGASLKLTKSFDKTEANVETYDPLVESFTADVKSGDAPLTVTFTFTAKYATDFQLLDGETTQIGESAKQSPITYEFENPGTYTVTLQATNSTSGKKTVSTNQITVTVNEPSDENVISTVKLKFAVPSVGATPATSSGVTGDGITCTNIEWATDAGITNKLASGTTFAAKTKYYVKVTLTNASNYRFGTTAPTVYINDININNYGNSEVNLNGQTLTVVYKNFDPTSSDISSVSANVTAPATGRSPSESATLGATTYTASSVKWYKDGSTTAMNTTDKFETNTKYKVTIVLEASGSNAFNSSLGITNAKINGNDPSEFKRDSSTKVTMSYLFPATVTPTGPGITFTMDPTSPKIPSTSNSIAVKYSYTITGDPKSSILDFGDGVQKDLGTQTSGSITHEYTMLGSYTATLTSTNADATTSKQLKFSVTKDSLIAKIEVSPSSGAAPLKVTLKDASTGTISSRIWDFGDGSGSSTDKSVTHTYEKPGTYTVTLTVSDGKDTSKAISAITVSKAADTESGNKTAVNYEPLMTIGDIEIPSPLDLIAEFIRLFQSMIDFDNYTIFSSSESEEE